MRAYLWISDVAATAIFDFYKPFFFTFWEPQNDRFNLRTQFWHDSSNYSGDITFFNENQAGDCRHVEFRRK